MKTDKDEITVEKDEIETSVAEDDLGMFNGKNEPELEDLYLIYQESLNYQEQQEIGRKYEETNNFYNAVQWQYSGVGDMSTPQFNIAKKLVNTFVGIMVSDNIHLTTKPRALSYNRHKAKVFTAVGDRILKDVFDNNDFSFIAKEFCQDAAICGDGFMHFYFDNEWDTGDSVGEGESETKIMGSIMLETLQQINVHFANQFNPNVQEQELIDITKRAPVRLAKRRAKENGIDTWSMIAEDTEGLEHIDDAKWTKGDCQWHLTYWRDFDTGHIWACEWVRGSWLKEPFDTECRYFPIVKMSWDKIQNSCYGQSMITGIIDNNDMINRLAAMMNVGVGRGAFQTIVYDANRFPDGFDNALGAEIGVQGGSLEDLFRVVDGSNISPQAFQLFETLYDKTLEVNGASKVLTGDTKAYNTSAIVATSKNSMTVHEPSKIQYQRAIKECGRIIIDMARVHFGERFIMLPFDVATEFYPDLSMAYDYTGMQKPEEIPVKFSFKDLEEFPLNICFEATAGSFITQNARQEEIRFLVQNGLIDTVQYLKRVDPELIPDVEALIADKEQEKLQQMQMMGLAEGSSMTPNGVGMQGNMNPAVENITADNMPSGKGNNVVASAINKGNIDKVM